MGFWDSKKQFLKKVINEVKGDVKGFVHSKKSDAYEEPTYKAKPIELETLRKNVLDQTAYTPQAEKYIKKMPLRLLTAKDTKGSNAAKGAFVMGQYNSAKGGITVHPNGLNPKNRGDRVVGTLRHEITHSLDENVNNRDEPNASYVKRGRTSGNSYLFEDKVAKNDPKYAKYLKKFLSNYMDADQRMRDTESFAEYGSNGSSVMRSPLAPDYRDIYVPATKNLLYSPVYPSNEYLRRFMPELYDKNNS